LVFTDTTLTAIASSGAGHRRSGDISASAEQARQVRRDVIALVRAVRV